MLQCKKKKYSLELFKNSIKKPGCGGARLMWNVLLCAVNMPSSHWLIKNLLWPVTARWEIQAERGRKKVG